MATTLDWETLQRNYVRSSTRGDKKDQQRTQSNSGDVYVNGLDTQGLNCKGSLNSQRVTVKSHVPELVKTKISRAAEGNFYAVFKDQSSSERSMSQNRSISPYSARNLPLKGAEGLKLDYNGGDMERFKSVKQSRIVGDQLNSGMCTLEESTMTIMEKKKDFEDNHGENHLNNTNLRADPRKRYVQSKNSLNANSFCVRSRRYQVKSEGNLEEKVKNSRSLLLKRDIAGPETNQGSDHVEIHRINGGKSGIYISDPCEVTDMITNEEKNRGLKCRQELVDQSNYFGKMLKQFKEKENKREEMIAKRKQGIIEKSQPELTQESMDFEMKREISDSSLHKLGSNQTENAAKFDEIDTKPRFPRRKISYMDSWLQSQQSRITNLVEAVRGESLDSENECQSRKSSIGFIEAGFHPHAEKNTTFAAGEKRKKFSHTKTASFDTWYSRDSDTESEVLAASEVSDSGSYRSIPSDADATWHPRGVEMPPSAPQGRVDSDIVRSEHVNETRPMGGAHEQESVNFSWCNKPLGQKCIKRAHPLAVVKPFHVDQKDEIEIGEQNLKTPGESSISATTPPLETDLDTVLSSYPVTEAYGERKVPVNAGKLVMQTKNNQESSTRVAIVTIQKKQVGGVVEKRAVKHGVMSTNSHSISENQGEIIDERGEKSTMMEHISGNQENLCQNEGISSEKGSLHDERDNYEYLQDVEGRRERFLGLRAQFDQPRSPEQEKSPKTIRSSKVHIEPVQQTQRGSIIFNFDSKNATCTAKVDLRDSEAKVTSDSESRITLGLQTCETISSDELADLNCQRLEFLTEAFKQNEIEENEEAERKSLCHGVTDIASTGYPIELLYRDNLNLASSEDRTSTEDRNIPYYIDGNLYFMSDDGLRPDFDRASVISSDSRLTGFTDRTVTDSQSIKHPFGSPQSRSAEITSSEEEDSTSDEEELKTLSERIRPWNPMESEALGRSNDIQERDAGNTNLPVVMRKRQGKGAVDRINKSLSVVMGELKELRKQDIDLAKQLLTLGKSIKEFKKQKQEMEEEMMADYFMDMESDQLSVDDNFSLASYDSQV